MKFSATLIINLAFLFVGSTARPCNTDTTCDAGDVCDELTGAYCCEDQLFCCPNVQADTNCPLDGCSIKAGGSCADPVQCSYEAAPVCTQEVCDGVTELENCQYRCAGGGDNENCSVAAETFCEPVICVIGAADCTTAGNVVTDQFACPTNKPFNQAACVCGCTADPATAGCTGTCQVCDAGECKVEVTVLPLGSSPATISDFDCPDNKVFYQDRCECGCRADGDCDAGACEKCIGGLCEVQITILGTNPIEIIGNQEACPVTKPFKVDQCACGCSVDSVDNDCDVTCPECVNSECITQIEVLGTNPPDFVGFGGCPAGKEFNGDPACTCGCSAGTDCDGACTYCIAGVCQIQIIVAGEGRNITSTACPPGKGLIEDKCTCGCTGGVDCLGGSDPAGKTSRCPECVDGKCNYDRSCTSSQPCCKITNGNDLVCASGCGSGNVCFENAKQGSCTLPAKLLCNDQFPDGGQICAPDDKDILNKKKCNPETNVYNSFDACVQAAT